MLMIPTSVWKIILNPEIQVREGQKEGGHQWCSQMNNFQQCSPPKCPSLALLFHFRLWVQKPIHLFIRSFLQASENKGQCLGESCVQDNQSKKCFYKWLCHAACFGRIFRVTYPRFLLFPLFSLLFLFSPLLENSHSLEMKNSRSFILS